MPSTDAEKRKIIAKLHDALRAVHGDSSLTFVAVSQTDWDRRFNKYLRKLRRDFPTEHRVYVRFHDFGTLKNDKGDRVFGFACPMNKSWQLDIERHPDVSVAIDTLIHEWAHVLEPPKRKNHHQRFSKKRQEIETHYLGD